MSATVTNRVAFEGFWNSPPFAYRELMRSGLSRLCSGFLDRSEGFVNILRMTRFSISDLRKQAWLRTFVGCTGMLYWAAGVGGQHSEAVCDVSALSWVTNLYELLF